MNMKLAKYILPVALLSIGLTGCVDLDYTEVTTNDEEWIYQSPVYGVQRLVTSVYARIPNGFDKNYEGSSGATLAAATDEADCAISNSSVHRFYNGGWSPLNPFSYTWENSYKAIAEANNFLEKLDKIDLSDYESNNDYQAMKAEFELYEYEVRYLRTYFYFDLVRTYGAVPFTLKTLSPEEANQMTRRPALEVMDWIVDELDEIAEYLPITYTTEPTQDIGRATRPMCLALKARTLLYKASPLFNTENNHEWWLDAARANYDVIRYATQWGISLGNYANIWGANNGDGMEVIMASKMGSISSWETYNYPIGVENGQGGMCPTQTLVDAYEYADGTGETFGERYAGNTINITEENAYAGLDPRFALTVVKNGDLWPNYNTTPIETFQGGVNGEPLLNATQTGYYLRKYCDGNVDISTNSQQASSPHAWIVMRLGEFYLNFAEAMYQYYGNAETPGEFGLTANGAINTLRDRADVMMPHWSGTPSDWWERYKRERFVELAFEDQRFWDIRRWKCGNESATVTLANLQKTANSDIVLTRQTETRGWDDKYYFFPIPFAEINKNPNLEQNPGWTTTSNNQ